MSREKFLDELSDNFPSQSIYSYDEMFRYDTDRRALMDAVLDSTFENYECAVKECEFRYKITADAVFHLEVTYEDDVWKKSFPYITEAFEIGEAAYRFFVAAPRALDEGKVLLAAERQLEIDKESFLEHDHCLEDDVAKPAELIYPPVIRIPGQYVKAYVLKCTDDTYVVSVIHMPLGRKHEELLEASYTDLGLAELIANGYVENFDQEVCPGPLLEVYQQVYRRVTH